MKLKALIFDVDGTLADTEEAHRNAFNESFRRHGRWVGKRYAHLLSTAGGRDNRGPHRLAAAWPRRTAALTARIAAIHATKTDIYGSMVAAGQVALRDEVAP
jgi:beta-phosphoglucomutase-like phosphatase (HAD superfamily)